MPIYNDTMEVMFHALVVNSGHIFRRGLSIEREETSGEV
jgi:hypothetical protein